MYFYISSPSEERTDAGPDASGANASASAMGRAKPFSSHDAKLVLIHRFVTGVIARGVQDVLHRLQTGLEAAPRALDVWQARPCNGRPLAVPLGSIRRLYRGYL